MSSDQLAAATETGAVVLRGGPRHRFGFTAGDWSARRQCVDAARYPNSAWPADYRETTRTEVISGRDGKKWLATVWTFDPREAAHGS